MSLFHRLLLLLHPELAHCVGLLGLKIYQALFARHAPISVPQSIHLAPFKVCFPNRLGLAAGFDKNAEVFPALARLGFGFIEVGTVTPLAQAGNLKPRLWRVGEKELVNHMGFNSVGMKVFYENISRLKRRTSVPLLINIGKNKKTEKAILDYKILIETFSSLADAFVVNLSSPNTPGLRDLQSEAFLSQLAEMTSHVPLFIKLAPDLANSDLLVLLSALSQEKRFSGVVLANTSVSQREKKAPHLPGGLSGPSLFARTLECVSLARKNLRQDQLIIGVGGVDSLYSAQLLREAGADLVEIYTGFVYQGPRLVRELAQLR